MAVARKLAARPTFNQLLRGSTREDSSGICVRMLFSVHVSDMVLGWGRGRLFRLQGWWQMLPRLVPPNRSTG